MTMVVFDGFDRYSTIGELPDYGVPWVIYGSPVTSTTVPSGTGNSIDVSDSAIQLELPDFGGLTYIVGGNFRFKEVGNSLGYTFSISETITSINLTTQLTLAVSSISNKLEVLRGNTAGTILATGTTVILPDTWYYIEFKFNVHNTTGLFEVKLDGLVEIAEQTGLDTQDRTNNTCLALSVNRESTNSNDQFVDNLYVLDTATTPNDSYIGPCDIKMLDVTGDSSVAWTPTGAGTTNADRVDEANPHDGDTTYVASSVLNDKDLYTLEDSSAGIVVSGVKLVTIAKKTDAGTKDIDTLISVSATEQANTKSLTTSYVGYADYFDTSDGGTTEWTKTTLDSALIGVEVTL